MKSFREIKSDYDFSVEDERLLGSLGQLMDEHAETVMGALHSWVLRIDETSRFFRDETRKQYVFEAHRKWFHLLFAGVYDTKYYEKLLRIGQTHVKVSVDAHYMNRAVNVVRNCCIDILNQNFENTEERTRLLVSVEKILDINLDIITASYIEEELKTFSPAYRVRNALISFSERFAQTMNLVLVLALIGLTLGVVALFVMDLKNLVTVGIEHGIITALGSLLVFWIMIELMNTEIKHLKGGKFRISVFVGVALVAFIRDTLIMALKHESIEKLYYLIALILTLGIVFWLVTRAEERNSS
ncbi:MAG TPA: protoglobin domain-containing protein [Dissulfurispiraceae bacterium]|nr:protoglobin domain-containing protein [Dissulfurispiraceae bacterium]